jgi:hypothetical protein
MKFVTSDLGLTVYRAQIVRQLVELFTCKDSWAWDSTPSQIKKEVIVIPNNSQPIEISKNWNDEDLFDVGRIRLLCSRIHL